jgi:hypothetical protein
MRRNRSSEPSRPDPRLEAKSAYLVGDEIAQIMEDRDPVERYGQTFIWCNILGITKNPWLVNVNHIVRLEP